MIDEKYCFDFCTEHKKDCSCGFKGRCEFEPAKAPAYAQMRCYNCGKHHGYIPKPENLKLKRPAAHKDLVRKSGVEHCQMCLRHQSQLVHPDHLQGHHVEEYCKGGSADSENVWIVCTACHSLINWARTYINRKQPGLEVKEG